MNISVIYNGANGDTYLDEIVQSVTWFGDIYVAHRTLTITLLNTRDGNGPAETYEVGREVRFYSEGAERFRGFIFRTEIDQVGTLTITAYDESVYLAKNTDTKRFVNVTASQVVRTLCTEFDIEAGEIADTGYVIPKLILNNMTLWNMMTTALTVTYRQTGRRYFIYASVGRLNLVERNARLATNAIESATNLMTACYSQSIEDLRNQVRVIAGDINDPEKRPIIETVRDDESVARFGLMQALEQADSDAAAAEIKQLAAQRLADLNVIDDEATITALGYDDTYAGVSVYVYEPMTQIMGGYYVTADTHTYSAGLHTMALTLSATDDLPTMEYVPPYEPKED